MSHMSDDMTSGRGRLREFVAEEIRVLLARKRISAAELARRTGLKQSTMSRRMTGETAFDMDDLEVIAKVLEVEVADLLPKTAAAGRGGRQGTSPNDSSSRLSRLALTSPPGGPFGQKPGGSTRPGSSVRRPVLIDPGRRAI